jgi:hypothetical protein
VIQVSQGLGRGLFNPQAMLGDILDGIMLSTYTTARSLSVAQNVLDPFRAKYDEFGVSTNRFEADDPTPISL